MGKVLTEAQVRQFHETGILSPVRAVSEDEASDCRTKLEAFEADTGLKVDLVRLTTQALYTRVTAEFAAGKLGLKDLAALAPQHKNLPLSSGKDEYLEQVFNLALLRR